MGVVFLAADETRFVLPHGVEMIWGSIAFLLLFGVLAWKVFPVIKKVLAEREAKIRSGLEAAEQSKVEADRLLEQYRRQLDEARGDSQKIIEEAKRTAESLRQDLVQKAEREAQDIVNRARADVAGEAERAKQQLRGELASLSLELARRVIEREFAQPESARQFVDRTIAELAATGNGGGNGHR
ncbi:MAG: F0F1 ATP synthase subunit B [Actinobacteria bacterium]|nr:MAG: F0F1 ATP synthase subunit B [Actinomycetota bacterium]